MALVAPSGRVVLGQMPLQPLLCHKNPVAHGTLVSQLWAQRAAGSSASTRHLVEAHHSTYRLLLHGLRRLILDDRIEMLAPGGFPCFVITGATVVACGPLLPL